MTIDKKIDDLRPYFKGLKVTDNYNIIEVLIKKTWGFHEIDSIDFQVKEHKDNPNLHYYMFYSDEKSFDEIMDYVNEYVIKHNLEIEEKENLLRAKVEELKRVFETKTLEELSNLTFTTEQSLKLNTKNKIEDGVTEEFPTNSKSN